MPNIENGTVPPRRIRNADRRPREYLTPTEVELLMKTARKRGRYGHRDTTMILIAYRHMLRVGEVCTLRWNQIDFGHGLLHVRRLKNGMPVCTRFAVLSSAHSDICVEMILTEPMFSSRSEKRP